MSESIVRVSSSEPFEEVFVTDHGYLLLHHGGKSTTFNLFFPLSRFFKPSVLNGIGILFIYF